MGGELNVVFKQTLRGCVAGKILVVDDEPAIRSLVARALKEDGHDVVAVENGSVAYKLVLQETFDLVVTNNCMPGMAGAELVRALRHRLPSLPIVRLDDGSQGNGPEFQVPSDVVTIPKPFEVTAVKSAVRALLPEST